MDKKNNNENYIDLSFCPGSSQSYGHLEMIVCDYVEGPLSWNVRISREALEMLSSPCARIYGGAQRACLSIIVS